MTPIQPPRDAVLGPEHPDHPDHLLYALIREGVHALDAACGRAPDAMRAHGGAAAAADQGVRLRPGRPRGAEPRAG
ncbi:hypothetical protein A989_09888 [Xanthomonas translucens DAR61454]|nr:hypothetical protein A989_09888 [Xanthomonas translucens DAR61454]